MKAILAFVLIAFSTVSVFGQNFEGKIIYSNTYKSKSPHMSSKKWEERMGDTREFYIKDGDYKAVSNGTFMQWITYVNAENRLYTKTVFSETAYWDDGLINRDSILSIELNKNVLEIIGYECDELILTCKSGIQKYYFNASLKVDVSLFENLKYGNWYAYLEASNALPLKIIGSNSQFTTESTATKVEVMKIKASDIQLSANQKTAKSPY